jgi:hypothetical protein
MPTITELCEQLADAFEARGVRVRENLQPGLSHDAIMEIVAPLRLPLPDDVVELYQWRNGHVDDHDPQWRHIRFRDNAFISLQRAVREYASIAGSYGADSTLHADRVDLSACIPISAFDGSWDVVACGAHLFGRRIDHPVVRVFQGIDMHFHSLPSMLQTCIAWVSSPGWSPLDGLPADEEMEIWTRHNPGIFGNAR